MGVPGRTPTPLALVRLKGNPGHRKVNTTEPQPKPVAPRCPSWLSPEAKREWRRVSGELESLGLLTGLDLGVMVLYSTAFGRLEAAERDVAGRGSIATTRTGYETPSVALGIWRDAAKVMLDCANRLGLSPADRRRMAVAAEPATSRSGLLDVHRAPKAS